MKKIITLEEDENKISDFNDLLYSYSHKRFYDFLRISEVSTILKTVFAQLTVNDFVSKYPTLAVNSDEYIEHVHKILKHI